VLWINEFPDMDADKAVGKNTLVLRLGYAKSIAVYVGLVALSYVLVIVYTLLRLFTSTTITYATLIVLLTIPIAMKAIKGLKANYRDPHAIIPANAGTVMLHLSFGILAIFGFVIGAFAGL
jgi:1,4-dihydroxy-2-naphthoate octaprenyltransferase